MKENTSSGGLNRLVAWAAALCSLLLLALAIWPISGTESPETITFLGRFHPILVHLPIGFLLALLLLEILDLLVRSAALHHSTYVMAWLGAGAAVFAVAAGLMLAYPGNYSEELLGWHRWLGTLTAIGTIWILAWKIRRSPREDHGWSFVYHPLLFLTVVLLGAAGHYGGSLTHGRDYLTEYMPDALRSLFRIPDDVDESSLAHVGDPREAVVFTNLIEPIFRTSCVSCHGPERQRGGLRLDSHAALVAGGESGPDIDLIARSLRLPMEDDRRMPPKDKPQLEADEISLITWWIRNGGSEDARVRDLVTGSQIERILEDRLGIVAEEEGIPMRDWKEIEPVVRALNEDLEVKIGRVAGDRPALEIVFQPPETVFGDTELARLDPIHTNLIELNLANSRITDKGLAHVAVMKNLTRLDLSNTGITDSGLAHLAGLNRLSYLNIFGTEVTDEGLEHLVGLQRLRRVYLWRTNVTDEGVDRLHERLRDPLQVAIWEAEIRELRERIESSEISISLGDPSSPATASPTEEAE